MDPIRHQRVSELFAEAVGLDEAVRRAFLESRCEGDPGLVEEILSLLSHHQAPQAVVGTGILNIGALLDTAAQAVDPADSGPSMGSALASTGQYTILRVLGEGGMGTVYLAEQDRPRRTVALKVMRTTISGASRMRKRFELEAEVLGRLEHPGIARIYDAGVASVTTPEGTATVPYFAMEYVDGFPLVEFCERNKLGTRDRMALMAQVADAVAMAHRHGIVHRDLKPANVLVDAKRIVKVLDFGVARATDSDLALTTVQTDVGQLIGTLGYMSPEQIAGDPSKVGVRTDVYALGAITYELLASRPMVDARKHTVAQVAKIIQDEDPPSLSTFGRVFRGDLETIVSKAIEKDPTRRYADAAEFAADVRRYLRDEPIIARPATTFYQIGKFARRNRALVGGVIATLIVLAAGLVGTTIGWLQATEATRLAKERQGEAERATTLAERRREEAVAAQARADNRFGQLRKLARTFIYDFHDMVADLPGSLEARKKLVTSALEYLDGLAKEATDDIELQNELSEGYLRVGQVQGYGSKQNLGDHAAAMASFRRALDVRQAALATHPDHVRTLDGICIIRNHIANLTLSQGKHEEALAEFKLVLEDRKKLAVIEPNDTRFKRAIGVGHQWIGNTYRAMAGLVGDELEKTPEDAERLKAKERDLLDQAFEHYKAHLDTALALEGKEPLVERDIPVAYEKLGDVYMDRKEHDAAMGEYVKALERREGRYKANPNNAEARSDLLASSAKTGYALLNLTRLDESRVHLERALELSELSVREQPDDAFAKINLFVTYNRLGQLYSSMAQRAQRTGRPIEEQKEFAAKGLDAAMLGKKVLSDLDAAGKLDASKKAWFGPTEELIEACTKVRDAIDSGKPVPEESDAAQN
ncbi:MAG: protein kinase [Phycisphaerae bacterium]|nr:protein kinase [Phycisphaerae bacterium]